MTAEQLRKLHREQPFRPFRIHLADGRSLAVPHPDFLWITPNGRTAAVFSTDDDAFDIVDLLLVTSLEVLKDSKNGRSKKRGA